MRWQGRRESDNVEDRREDGGGGYDDGSGGGFGIPFPGGGGGGGFPMPGQGGGIGIVGILVILGLALLFGVDPRILLNGGGGSGMEIPGSGRQVQLPHSAPERAATSSPQDDSMKRFVAVVLGDTEDIWTKIFRDMGKTYVPPKLVLFRGGIRSGCGVASAQMGPFYCPTNRKIYIDLSFYEMLKRRFKAPGEFAQAYVIAHEVGHHVQNSLGQLGKVQQLQAAASGTQKNALQVRVELQADCYAGVWAKNTDRINKTLEPGDIESAMRAAQAIGDDAIQKSTRGYAVPDSFTHGSSEQRVYWFKKGYDEGTIGACDTFGTGTL
ncbi:MAG: neutral zinc metallopeptidase [Rhodomicrobium sp.]